MSLESSLSRRSLGSYRRLQVPRFRFHLKVETVGRDTVLVSSGGECRTLTKHGLAMIARQINGRNTVEQIAAGLEGTLPAGAVNLGILTLQVGGAIVETRGSVAGKLERTCDLLEADPEISEQRISALPVTVISLDGTAPAGIQRALRSMSLPVSQEGKLAVVIVEDYLHKGLEQFNQESRLTGRFWMPVKPTGQSVWWGPLFRPDAAGCWNCLALRLRENRWSEALSSRVGTSVVCHGDSDPELGCLPEAGFQLAALSLFRWIADPDAHELESRVCSLDGRSLVLYHHPFSALDHCPVCGRREKETHRLPLTSAGQAELAADLRSLSLEQIFERLTGQVSPITGICGSLDPLFEEDSIPIHVYGTGRAYGPWGRPAWFPRSTPIFWGAGRGTSRLEARTAALCEAIERYAGVFRGCEPRLLSTFRELGPAAVHPNSVMSFSQRQYSDRDSPKDDPGRARIPELFDEDCEIEWTPVWSVTAGTSRHIPSALCYYGFEGAGTRFCRPDSSGCAAGRSFEEALVGGFLELVERDAAAIWWYNRIPRAGVDLGSLDDPWISRAREYHAGLRRNLTVLEITADIPIPTFVSMSRERKGSLDDLILGFGSAIDPLEAIHRSVLEMHQLMPLILAGESTVRETGLTEASQGDDAWLRPCDTGALRSAVELGILAQRDAAAARRHRTDLEFCLELAGRAGIELLVLDQTRRESVLPVAKVFAPGLRPWWPRFAPGRLYDVPVRLAWLESARSEPDLNPAHLTL